MLQKIASQCLLYTILLLGNNVAYSKDCGSFSKDNIPTKLSQTCLYEDISKYLISSELTKFTPNYPLWTNGAGKTRWVYLPPGTQIDTLDHNHWVFPKNTIFFKEFTKTIPKDFYSTKQIKVETRLLVKINDKKGIDSWLPLTYAWDEQQKDAILSGGYENVLGTNHDIPTKKQCIHCHQGSVDAILGFDAIQLSTARLWENINAIPPRTKVWNLELLQEANLLTHPFEEQPIIPGIKIAKQALGYMHGNCAHCHNPNGKAFKEDVKHMTLRHDLNIEKLEDLPAYKTTVNQRTKNFTRAPYIIKGAQDDELAIYHSAIFLRMNSLMPKNRMPQLATKEIDHDGVDKIHKWLQTLPTPDDLDLDLETSKNKVSSDQSWTDKIKSLTQKIMTWFNISLSDSEGLTGTFKFNHVKAIPKIAIIYFPEDKSLETQPIIDHYDGDFTKSLIIGAPGEDIVLRNSDEIGHTIYAKSNGKMHWDIDYMPANTSTTRKINWEEDEFVELKCKIHDYMKSWAGAIKSKYYKIIEFDENQEINFEFSAFPQEFSQIKIWMPKYEPITLKLDSGEKTSLDLVRKGTIRGTLELSRK